MSHQQSTIAIKLKPAAERAIRKQHPWVFDESITKVSKEAVTGDLAVIFDNKKNKFLAVGLYDAESPIRIKVLSTEKGVKIDDKWVFHQIEKAFWKRKDHLNDHLDSCRIVYGENDGLPGLIIDKYGDMTVVKLYSGIWIGFLDAIVEALRRILQSNGIFLRLSRNVEKHFTQLENGSLLLGESSSPIVQFQEYGVTFEVDLINGHKTGFFLDHRHNRVALQQMSKDKSVLDVFSYAGGFSVHALVGGASRVVSVDISKQALSLARHNALINHVEANHETISGDAFAILQDLANRGETFDRVIIDPPSFAKKASEHQKALVAYERLARLGAELMASDGVLILASCSSRVSADDFFALVNNAVTGVNHRLRLYKKTFHDFDHPVTFPEGSYLKCGYWK